MDARQSRLYMTKSLFMRGRSCPKAMWLDAWGGAERTPASFAAQERMRTGGLIGEMAQALYSGGEKIEWREGLTPEEHATQTQKKIKGGAQALFEAGFLADSFFIKADAIWRDETGWHLDEVKSSTAKAPDALLRNGKVHDLAFQWHVLKRSGFPVASGALVLINREYTWAAGEHEPTQILTRIDLTEQCQDLEEKIAEQAEELASVLFCAEPPQVATNKHCNNCDYHAHCHKDQLPHDVVFLPGIKAPKVTELRLAGYASIDRLPEDHPMPTDWARARHAVLTGKPVVEVVLREALEEIEFPAAFIDFECCMPALPIYPGTRPYTQVPFEWSAHVLDKRGKLQHATHLHDTATDPRPAFCQTLWNAVKACRTLVYYTDYEVNRLEEMKIAGIPYAEELCEMIHADGVDLHKIVRENVYFAEFKGSTSIKRVLPVLVPWMTYDGLDIADGDSAAVSYLEMLRSDPDRAAEIREALLVYCKQDTLAMVEIYKRLLELAQPQVESTGQMSLSF